MPDPRSVDDRGRGPDRYPGTPGWVKAFGLVALIVVLLVAFALLTGLGGPHGPQRHGADLPLALATLIGRA